MGRPKKVFTKEKAVHPPAAYSDSDKAQVLNHLNVLMGTSFRIDGSQAAYIAGRLAEGYTVEELKSVVELKLNQWAQDPVMQRYLRPATLFNRKNCEAYLQEVKLGAVGPHRRENNAREDRDWESEPDSL